MVLSGTIRGLTAKDSSTLVGIIERRLEMRKFTLHEIRLAANEGEGFCRRCGSQGPIEQDPEDREGRFLPCEACGALGMMPAEGILAVLALVDLEEI
jgi:hypothetical protein